jgi:hypothetical protein
VQAETSLDEARARARAARVFLVKSCMVMECWLLGDYGVVCVQVIRGLLDTRRRLEPAPL